MSTAACEARTLFFLICDSGFLLFNHLTIIASLANMDKNDWKKINISFSTLL